MGSFLCLCARSHDVTLVYLHQHECHRCTTNTSDDETRAATWSITPSDQVLPKAQAVRRFTRKLIAPSAFETSLVHWYGSYSRKGEILASAQARVLLTFTSSRLT